MPRPSQLDEQREKLLKHVCEVFAELGYQRTTTAKLAERCGVRENILYRLWPDKKAMFLAAIENIFQDRVIRWRALLADRPSSRQAVEALVSYESKHQGEFGFYRVVFTALVEAEDPEIREAIQSMYRRFHDQIVQLVRAARGDVETSAGLSADATSWAMIGLATVSNICRELELLRPRQREKMFQAIAEHLLSGAVPS